MNRPYDHNCKTLTEVTTMFRCVTSITPRGYRTGYLQEDRPGRQGGEMDCSGIVVERTYQKPGVAARRALFSRKAIDPDATLVGQLRRPDAGAAEANAAYQKLRSRRSRRNDVSWEDLAPAFDEKDQHAKE